MSEVHTNRSDGRRIPQANADRIGVFACQAAESDMWIGVPPVIKHGHSKSLPDRQGKTQLRVQNQQLKSARGNSNHRTGGRIVRIAARGKRPLRSSPVQWETT